jgi:hypothetical protein
METRMEWMALSNTRSHNFCVLTLTSPLFFVVSLETRPPNSTPSMIFSLPSTSLKQNQKTHPAKNAATAIPPYVHTMYGSCETGVRAIPIAAPTAIVTQNTLVTTARRFSGELLNAISIPVTRTQISLSEPKMYPGAWIQTFMLAGGEV